jgi:hypothetical protein
MKLRQVIFLVLLISLVQCGPSQRSQEDRIFLEMNAFISLFEYDLQVLEREIINLGEEIQQLYADKSTVLAKNKIHEFDFKRGSLNNAGKDNPLASTIYISELASDEDGISEMVVLTTSIDKRFKEIVDRHDMVSQVYFNSNLHVNRLYPPYDALSMLTPQLDLTTFNFYYLADEKNNPEARPVWVDDIYIDPVGRGWMISLIHPVYFENELKMVLGFDITLNAIIGNYLDKFDRNFVIVDATGTLVAGKTSGIESLSLPPLKNHTYNQTISSNSFRMEDFNLFRSKSQEVRKMASEIILANKKDYILSDYGLQITISSERMSVLDWILLDLVF